MNLDQKYYIAKNNKNPQTNIFFKQFTRLYYNCILPDAFVISDYRIIYLAV